MEKSAHGLNAQRGLIIARLLSLMNFVRMLQFQACT